VNTSTQNANSTAAPTISARGAQAVLDAAVAKAEQLGLAAVVAVVDSAGVLKALLRMDGAPLLGVEMAPRKAYTSVAFGGAPTGPTFEFVSQVPSLLAAVPALPGVTLAGGGVPLLDDGTLIGAVGVSAGTVDQDAAIAEAAGAVLSS
jgi:uncharacterized protein GlcG (DUF336 family)